MSRRPRLKVPKGSLKLLNPRCAEPSRVEQVYFRRDFGKQRLQRLVEQFEPGDFRIVQIDHDTAALRGIDPRLAQGLLEPLRLLFFGLGWLVSPASSTPHGG